MKWMARTISVMFLTSFVAALALVPTVVLSMWLHSIGVHWLDWLLGILGFALFVGLAKLLFPSWSYR